jgi:glutamate--cysteine ligase
MIDTQRGEDWAVAAALAATLLDDPAAAGAAWEATEPLCADGAVPTAEQWSLAARLGPADPVIGKAVRACFGAADAAMADSGAPADLRAAVAAFAQRYAERGRCPADDLLEGIRG